MIHRLFLLSLSALLAQQLASPSAALAQITPGKTSQISLSVGGGIPEGGASYLPNAGVNGTGLAFESGANNLVENDLNQATDAFFTDPKSKKVARASISTAGVEGDKNSGAPSISPVLPDGFFAVAFHSQASNLGSTATPGENSNIFLRFPTLNITELVSAGPSLTAADGPSYSPALTIVPESNGKYRILLVFESGATNLVADDTNGFTDIFLATLEAPGSSAYTPSSLVTITRISRSATPGLESDGNSTSPEISADGRFVVFSSRATNLVSPAITNQNKDLNVYRYDIKNGTTILVSKAQNGTPGTSDSSYPQISYTGRYIGYFTRANNIVGNSPSIPTQPFVVRYDVDTDSNSQVNLAADGVTSGIGQLASLGLSANGRLITFGDASSTLVAGDSNNKVDIFVKDMLTGAVSRLSNGAGGEQSNQDTLNPTLTAQSFNGLTYGVAFDSLATNLTSPSRASQLTDVYATSFKVTIPKLSRGSKLETPPDVKVASRKISLTAQSFVARSARSLADARHSSRLPRAGRQTVNYEFTVTRTVTKNGKRQTIRTKLVSKRNTITVSRAPGTYQVRNTAKVVDSKTNKTVVKTASSPTQVFTLRK